MGLHVPHEIDSKNHARPDFSFNTNVHVHGARRAKVGIIHIRAQAEAESLLQQRSHVVRIRRIQIKGRLGLILLLERGNLVGDSPDGNRSSGRCTIECQTFCFLVLAERGGFEPPIELLTL
jgi:hypothetical protein